MKERMVAFSMALLLLLSVSGCAYLPHGTSNPNEMSPTKLAVWGNNIYVDSYDAYIMEVKMASDSMSEDQKEFLRAKKKVLVEMYDALLVLNQYLDSGTVPRQQVTDAVIRIAYKILEAT